LEYDQTSVLQSHPAIICRFSKVITANLATNEHPTVEGSRHTFIHPPANFLVPQNFSALLIAFCDLNISNPSSPFCLSALASYRLNSFLILLLPLFINTPLVTSNYSPTHTPSRWLLIQPTTMPSASRPTHRSLRSRRHIGN
jgi:hypothetical protein